MSKPRLFLCGEAKTVSDKNREIVRLSTRGQNQNVNLSIENVVNTFARDISPRVVDLLEIAAYVFAADASINRGRAWQEDASLESWDRDFKFIIPVIDFDFWKQKAIQQSLREILTFLSNDKYEIEFQKAQKIRDANLYFDYGESAAWPFSNPERVIMFSGGLDSLAGAVESLTMGNRVVLVSHRSAPAMDKRQRELVKQLIAKFPNNLFHVPVWVNKEKNLSREFTQRTRSFLFSAIGVAVAESTKADGVRFYENGIVSLNLPISDEVVRARASRTTHPLGLSLFGELYTKILGRPFTVDNPYIFKTKSEVLNVISNGNCNDLIRFTCSCAHTGHFQSKSQWHCGRCSQCIDRRVAIMANRLSQFDEETDYQSDVFTGARKEGYDKNIAVNFARHVTELKAMSENEVNERFSLEISRAIRIFPKKSTAAQDFVGMHIRYAEYAFGVLQTQLIEKTTAILDGSIEPSSMLALIFGNAHKVSGWRQYAEKINEILHNGIPVVCEKRKPDDEPELQKICDGLLRAAGENLTREFPFMQWSIIMTKPDWSKTDLNLWIELKYVKSRKDIARILRDISEDITKYGDLRKKVLYVVYDPAHSILDEKQFATDIEKHGEMMVFFIR